jgi:PAS domain S-box-containing protein
VLPVWIAAGFLLLYNFRSRRALTEQRMLDTARALTMVVDRELANVQASLSALAASTELVSGDLPAFYRRALVVLQAYPGTYILLADSTGQELINTFRPFGAAIPKHSVPDAVRQVYTTGKPVISNVFKGVWTGRFMVSVHVPVFRGGRVVYDLGMNVPVDRFAAILVQQQLPPDWIGRVFDRNHVMVARTRLAERFVGGHSGHDLGERMKETAEGTAETVNLEGVLTFNSFSRSASSGWTVAIGIPKAIMMAELWGWLRWTLAGTVLLSLTGLALALPIWRGVEQSESRSRRLSAIVESSDDAIVGYRFDGIIENWNYGAERLFGYSASEIVGRNVSLLVPDDQMQGLQDRIGRVRHGEVIEQYSTTRQHKNGLPIPVALKISPIRDRLEAIVGVSAIVRDITDRKKLETRLSTTAENLRAVLQSTEDFVIALDSQWRLTYANRLPWGAEVSTAIDQNLWETYPQLAGTVFETELRRALKEGTPLQFEEYCAPLQAWFATTAYPSRSGLLVLFRDVTEKRSLEVQVRHAQKMEAIGQLAAGIAHEINTPIQYVADNTSFLGESWNSLGELFSLSYQIRNEAANGGVLPGTIAAFVASVEQADLDYLTKEIPQAVEQSLDGVQRVTKIVRAMKEFSHPEGDKSAVDINRAIETTLAVARNEWKYVADVHTCLDPALPAVPCFAGEFNQVILNLLINAAHAIADVVGDGAQGKGAITITTAQVENTAEIRVQDTGTGIPEKIRSRVFEPFFTTKDVGKGTGQGLAMAHSIIVKKHGGKIWFESETGKGTTFFLRLPLDMEPPQHVCHDATG